MPTSGCCHRAIGWWVGVFFLGVGLIGCATTRTAMSKCQSSYSQLMAKDEAEYCSQILYNHFEGQVTEWRGRCGKEMVREKMKIAEKLEHAQICSEQARRAEMLNANCELRLNKISESMNCIGEECAGIKEEMEKITAECDVPLLKGKLSDRIAQTNAVVDERMNSAKELKSLQKLMVMCDGIYDIRSKKQANARLSQIIKRIEKNKEMHTVQKEGSLLEQFQKGAQASCGFALTEVMKKIVEVSDKQIERISKKSWRKKRHIRRYNKYAARLARIDAQTLFPDSLLPLRDVLERLGSELTMPEPKSRPVAKRKSVEKESVSPSKETAVADKENPEEPTKKKVPDPDEEKKKAEASNTQSTEIWPISGCV